MLNKLSHRFGRPSPAFALAAIALFVALGGTSYAVAAGSITSAEIRNNDVRSKDVRNNHIRSGDVRNGSLLALDIKPGQLAAGPRGPSGPQGLRGIQGLQGQEGAEGVSGLQRVVAVSAVTSDSGKSATATCPGTKQVIGTGYELLGESSGPFPNQIQDVLISDVTISANLKSVQVRALETHATAEFWHVKANAICANVG